MKPRETPRRVIAGGAKPRARGDAGGRGGDSKLADKVATVIAAAIVLAVLAGAGILFLSAGSRAYKYAMDPARMAVQDIEVKGNVVLDRDEIIRLAGVTAGSPTLTVDPVAVKDRIAAHPRVEQVVVERRLPNRLVIELKERIPVGLVKEGNVIKGIDASGRIIPLIPAREEIKGPIITRVNETISQELMKEALEVIDLARPDLVNRISEIRLGTDAGIALLTTGEPIIIYLGRGNLRDKIERLRTALAFFDKSGQKKSYIDLRFNDIVTKP